jgi:hypothetical protein
MVTIYVQNFGLALPHKLGPNDAWIDGCASKCQECCEPTYSHSGHVAAAPMQYPLLECMSNFFDVPKGKNKEIQAW